MTCDSIMKIKILIKNERIDKTFFIHSYNCMYKTRKLDRITSQNIII